MHEQNKIQRLKDAQTEYKKQFFASRQIQRKKSKEGKKQIEIAFRCPLGGQIYRSTLTEVPYMHIIKQMTE